MALSLQPPPTKRQDDRYVLAGKLDDCKHPRQAENSPNRLLDPPVKVSDPYGWLRDESRSNEEVLDHLRAENKYTQQLTAHLTDFTAKLNTELLNYIQETDYTTPSIDRDYVYYTRTLQGKAYTIHCRAPKGSKLLWKNTHSETQQQHQQSQPVLQDEETLLDVNLLAVGKSFCDVGSVKVSPSQTLLLYTADFTGDEVCHLYVKDIRNTNTILHQETDLELYGSVTWGFTDESFFYLTLDAAKRPYQVWKRTLSKTNNNDNDDTKSHSSLLQGSDTLLFEELDELNWLGMYKSLDGKYLFIETSSKETTEIHYLDLSDESDDSTLQCVAPRRPKTLYEVEHRNNRWWISSNVGGLPNFALFTSPALPNCQDQWELVTLNNSNNNDDQVLFDGGHQRSLDSVTCFANHVVASGREGGLPRIWILALSDTEVTVSNFERLDFAQDAYDVGLGSNREFDTTNVVVVYDSMVTPASSIMINMNDTSVRTVLKEKVVPNYKKDDYGCQRMTVTARDGTTQVPVSMVYRQSVMEQHQSNGKPVPLHLYGYGSYGASMEADFVASRLPLLDRGVVYVVAHVRGGAEMGRTWYEEPNGAKYLCKMNTFNDFCDVARHFCDTNLTSPKLMSCEGRSAGGLLIGASINQAPELFKVALMGVPFVDVVPTMIDASIPLTCGEWEEWGCPNEEKFFEYMMKYNPMSNVQKKKYPACLLTGGLHDPRVQYWEPAKFAAELRHSQDPSSGPVCLKIDLSAGHFSASDRYAYLKEKAFQYAFVLDQLGISE